MKEETTTLLLKKQAKTEVKQETKLEKQILVEKKEKKVVKKLFSAPLNTEVVTEKPNFDKIEELKPGIREKIFKVEKEKIETKKKSNIRLKIVLMSICFVAITAFCITTGVQIAKASQTLQAAQSEYSANLLEVIQKIYSTETGNRSLSLFDTYPEEDLTAASIYETSNWFDKFCKFLTGFFGG